MLVSHNMDDVAKYADRILVMNEGELVLDGVPKKVFHYQDELEQIGLGVPQMTHLIHHVRGGITFDRAVVACKRYVTMTDC